MTLKTQKAISKSIYSLEKSGDVYIDLEKETYMNSAEIKFLTCNNLNLAVKNLTRNNMRQLLMSTNFLISMRNK